MLNRRILSLWFPRLGAERILRQQIIDAPFATVETQKNAQTLSSLSLLASSEGLFLGQSLSDARSICENLVTQPADAIQQAQFLASLHRWAGKFTPWVSIYGTDGLMMDISGCAHLFGGEAALAERILSETQNFNLSAQLGIADTVGAAWGLSRYGEGLNKSDRSGDAIAQEARATRSRAFSRKKQTQKNVIPIMATPSLAIAPIGQTSAFISNLTIRALRLSPDIVVGLNRLGIYQIKQLTEISRAALTRRFGRDVFFRLDQALGHSPEPVCPSAPKKHFAARVSFPDPIGLKDDISLGIAKVTRPLCEKLRLASIGARQLELSFYRTDHSSQTLTLALARPSNDPEHILSLANLHLPNVAPGFGFDMIRIEAKEYELLKSTQHSGHNEIIPTAQNKLNSRQADLISRLGARIGIETIIVQHPSKSHLPEKAFLEFPAAFEGENLGWDNGKPTRPQVIFSPQNISPKDTFKPPNQFKWRNRLFNICAYKGPERITPEWWLDYPDWRNGTRDYWCVTTDQGDRLWIYQAHGDDINGGWFCHGHFG